jgi:hypothetical protein
MALNCATAEDVVKTIKDQNVQMIGLTCPESGSIFPSHQAPAGRWAINQSFQKFRNLSGESSV